MIVSRITFLCFSSDRLLVTRSNYDRHLVPDCPCFEYEVVRLVRHGERSTNVVSVFTEGDSVRVEVEQHRDLIAGPVFAAIIEAGCRSVSAPRVVSSA